MTTDPLALADKIRDYGNETVPPELSEENYRRWVERTAAMLNASDFIRTAATARAVAFELAAKVCEARDDELGNTRIVEDMIVKAEMIDMAMRIRALPGALTPELREELVERGAAAGYKARHGYEFSNATPQTQDTWRTVARAVLSILPGGVGGG